MDLSKLITTHLRAGASIERIGRMWEKGVSPAAIARQLTDNSKHGQKFTVSDVKACYKIYTEAKTSVAITRNQTQALINDQNMSAILTQMA